MTRGLAEMKFLEPIQTTMGEGLAVARVDGGRIVATVTVVRPGGGYPKKPAVEKRFYPHMVFAWCEAHQVWHPERDGCPGCGTASGGEDDAGDGG